VKTTLLAGAALALMALNAPVARADAGESSIRCALNGKQIDIQLTLGNHINAFITVDGASSVSALDTSYPRSDHVIREFGSPTTWIIKANGRTGMIQLPSGKWRLLTCGGWVAD
jgi:hypothetical protein